MEIKYVYVWEELNKNLFRYGLVPFIYNLTHFIKWKKGLTYKLLSRLSLPVKGKGVP